LSEGGSVVMSGIPFSRRDEMLSGMETSSLVLRDEFRDGDWIALVFSVD